MSATPKTFLFHFKAFGMLCSNGVDAKNIPFDIRETIGITSGWVTLNTLTQQHQSLIWGKFHAAVMPAHHANKLGYIVFQYHLNFPPSQESEDYLTYCASMLHPEFKMAIDFRSRAWTDPDHIAHTIAILKRLRPGGVVLVASDDLVHEMLQKDREQTGIYPGRHPVRASIVLSDLCLPQQLYIRVHRRHGDQRVLTDSEMSDWASRLCQIASGRASIITSAASNHYDSVCEFAVSEDTVYDQISASSSPSLLSSDRKSVV